MGDSIEDTKARLRSLARERLAAISPRERTRLSAAACGHALAWPPLANAEIVLAYAPLRSEVDVEPLVDALLARGVTVCVPRLDWETRRIEPVPISGLGELELIERGVRQPHAEAPALPLRAVRALVAPGVAFDERGGRLGRGGGFYDRVLGDPERSAPALGICFEAQVLAEIPMEDHDRPVDALATPARLIDLCARPPARSPGNG